MNRRGCRPARYAPGPIRLPDRLADFAVRGFSIGRPEARATLEGHARAFLLGFNLAVRHPRTVHEALASVPDGRRGFAYEGAGMAAGFLDVATRGRAGAFDRLLQGPGRDYVHLLHVGYGWPPAPIRLGTPPPLPATPLLRWLAVDGAGFADVFFGGVAALRRVATSRSAHSAVRRSGAGRALWFVHCADVGGVTTEIERLPADARADVWAGVGLATTYAGCAAPHELVALDRAAGDARPAFLQGVMFAAAARTRSGIVPEHTRTATSALLGANPETVSAWTEQATHDLEQRTDAAAFETWRTRLRSRARDLGPAAEMEAAHR